VAKQVTVQATQQGEKTTPPCRTEEDRDTWALTLGGYDVLGFELQFGQDQGNNFVTLRFGFGIGGGISYTPYASIPGPALENRNQDGFVLSASGQAKFAAGPLSAKLEGGAARNYAEGVSGPYGGPNFSFRNRTLGIGASGSIAGQATYYTKRTSYYANQGTCHL